MQRLKAVGEIRSSVGGDRQDVDRAVLGWITMFILQVAKSLSNLQAKVKSCLRNTKFDWGQSTGHRLSGACPDGKFARVPQENKH